MLLELGNAHPQDVYTDVDPDTGTQTERRVDLPGPAVSYVNVADGDLGRPVGIDRRDGESEEDFLARDAAHIAETNRGPAATFPDTHDDSLLNDELSTALAAVPDGPGKGAVRRILLRAHLTQRDDGITHLPNHEAFVALCHPRLGTWTRIAAPNTVPSWVHCPDNPAYEAFLAEYFDCPAGRPADVEDTHYTDHGGLYPPGAIPDPLGGVTMLHTSWGRDSQALGQFGFNVGAQLGLTGTATASSATSLTGSAETGVSHTVNDAAGMILVCTLSPDAGKWAFVKSNTTGTTPVYTVDRWYTPATPGGSAATTPAATTTYVLTNSIPPAVFAALSTDTTTPSIGGTAGTADAPAATTAMTSEIATAGGGLIRRIWTTLTHTAGAATVVNTTTWTANGTDSLPAVVAKATLSPSAVAGGGGLTYLTLVSPTATLSASGDQETNTWSFTMS